MLIIILFTNKVSDLDQLIAPGEIYNLNTIQEFKKLDKQQYIKSRAKKVCITC